MKKRYDKLIRDNMPERILINSKEIGLGKCKDFEEFRQKLGEKFIEEAKEVYDAIVGCKIHPVDSMGQDKIKEELVDLLELIKATYERFGIDKEEVKERLEEKRKARGSFEQGWILKWVK